MCKPTEDDLIWLQHTFPIDLSPSILRTSLQRVLWGYTNAVNHHHRHHHLYSILGTVEPHYSKVVGTMKITLLDQVSHYIRVKKKKNI